MTSSPRILVVDDDPSILEVLDARLEAADFTVYKAGNADTAVAILKDNPIDLLVSDVKMPRKSGMDLFLEVRESLPRLPVIFLTAYGTIPDAVDAIKLGAVDYIPKPFDGRLLIQKIKDVLAIAKVDVKEDAPKTFQGDFLWGKSQAMKDLFPMVQKVAATRVNVLIFGESGVGKECIARYIHETSPRQEMPYVVVDCGSTPPGILESELFGHLKGAFTHAVKDKKGLIQASDKGTLFLDEIGNISHDMQCRLLRFLEEGKIRQVGAVSEKQVNARVLSATNADLKNAIDEGTFRQDLYYRLKGITLTIPSLRDRKEDIPELATFFVNKYAVNQELGPIQISETAMGLLMAHPWPGNIRELKNAVEAGAVLCRNHTILPEDLQLEPVEESSLWTDNEPDNDTDEFSIEQSEKNTIIRALKKSKGVQKAAADLLNISKRAIHYKIKKYDIKPQEYK